MTKKSDRDSADRVRFRLRLTGSLLLVLLSAVAARAVQLQAFDGEQLARRGEKQHRHQTVFVPKRGSILSRNGDPLAVSVDVQSVYVRPKRLQSPEKVASKVARALGMTTREVRRKFASKKPFVWLKRQVNPREAKRVRALGLDAIGLSDETKRFYPHGHHAGQVLGLVGQDAYGLEGVEQNYDRYIRRERGSSVVDRDGKRRRMLVKGLNDLKVSPGAEVQLTLNMKLQHAAEKHLETTVKQFGAKGGTVVMVDPFTGAILAMANYPFFDPNRFRTQNRSRWRNRAVTDVYEPGSVFKAVLAAAALEEGVVHREELFFCNFGRYRYGGHTIRDVKKHGLLSFAEVLQLSSNIGVTKVAAKLGRDRYHRYIRSFGFGEKTNVDLPGEVSGKVRPPHAWYDLDLAATSFGQSVSVTPLQMVMAFSAIANGGLLMKPYVVERVTGENGRVLLERGPEAVRRVISRTTAHTVVGILKGVVEHGTGKAASVEGFEVAGKTGTSEKADTVKGGYSKTKRIASFVGFAPAAEPRFVLLTLVDEPTVNVYGGVVAAPLFSSIATAALGRLRVTPRRRILPGITSGAGGVIRISQTIPRSHKPARIGNWPNLIGLSMREAMLEVRKHKLEVKKHKLSVELRGHGYVVDQRAEVGRRLVLTLKD